MKNNNYEIPDGIYVGDTIDITSGINDDGYKTVHWKLIIMEGEYKDKAIDKYYTLRSDLAKNFLLKELRLVGLSVKNGAELERRKTELFGKHILIEVKMNGSGFPAFYVKGLPKTQDDKPKNMPVIDW